MSRQKPRPAIVGLVLVMSLLVRCTTVEITPVPTPTITTIAPAPTRNSTPAGAPDPTHTPTPDPCTGWWCTVGGVVYTDAGNALDGASVTLDQYSYCSPTRGQHQTTTGPDGAFAFGEVFFHDTDRIRIQAESGRYEPALWDSIDHTCLYCSCFGSPVEMVLRAAVGQ